MRRHPCTTDADVEFMGKTVSAAWVTLQDYAATFRLRMNAAVSAVSRLIVAAPLVTAIGTVNVSSVLASVRGVRMIFAARLSVFDGLPSDPETTVGTFSKSAEIVISSVT